MLENWKLAYFEPGEGLKQFCNQAGFDDTEWIDIQVPGDVHRTLIDKSIIPNPYYDQNEFECAWIEQKEWWYRLRFDVPEDELRDDERFQLIFNGIDTFATIWLSYRVHYHICSPVHGIL